MNDRICLVICVFFMTVAGADSARAETETFRYDALGRLTGVAHADGPLDTLQIGYQFDAAGNRKQYDVTGANPPQRTFLPIPLGKLFFVVPAERPWTGQ